MEELIKKFKLLCKKYTNLYNQCTTLTGEVKTMADNGLDHILDRLRSVDYFIENRKNQKVIDTVLAGIEEELQFLYWNVAQALSNTETES